MIPTIEVIAARVLLFNSKNQILLVKPKNSVKSFLPGGWKEKGETIPQACLRELHEESGLIGTFEKVVFMQELVYDKTKEFGNIVHKFEFFCLCKVEKDELDLSWEDFDKSAVDEKCFYANEVDYLNDKNLLVPTPLHTSFDKIKNMPNVYFYKNEMR